MKLKQAILTLLLIFLLVGVVNAAATFTNFAAYGDAFRSTNDTHVVLKWNTTGSRTPWNTTGNITSGTTVEYVIVAGGGGGGKALGGGGGGAGGYWGGSWVNVQGEIPVTVGAGGAQASSNNTVGTPGGISIFHNITAMGGSGGGSAYMSNVSPGGSAGGAGTRYNGGAGNIWYTNVSNQTGHGNRGGFAIWNTTSAYWGGGGGGAMQYGTNATGAHGGSGGIAAYTNITGTLLTLAGGGGGGIYANSAGSRGDGGANATTGSTVGGAGAYRTTAATAAIVNTGSGGGGGGSTGAGTAGSGGVVIIRYKLPIPESNFTSNVTSGTSPLAVQFTDTSTNTPTSWNWSHVIGTASPNFLDGNIANGTEDGTVFGWAGIPGQEATLSSSITYAWQGSRSIKAISPGSTSSEGMCSNLSSLQPAGTYTLSAYIRGAVGGELHHLDLNEWDYNNASASGQDLTTTWTRYNVSRTVTTPTRFEICSRTDEAAVETWYVDGVQLELGSVNTTWQLPATADISYFSTSQHPAHVFSNVGNYTIHLNATNSYGTNTNTNDYWINVTSGGAPVTPVSSFTTNITSGTAPLDVAFTDTSTNTPTSRIWGAKNLTPGNNTWFAFNTTVSTPIQRFGGGNWSLNLTATNAAGSNTSTQITWANVTAASGGSAPIASFTTSPSFVRIPKVLSCTDTSTNTPTSWQWSWGDGTTNDTIQNPVHRYNERGIFTVAVTATNAFGSGASTRSIRVVGYENYY